MEASYKLILTLKDVMITHIPVKNQNLVLKIKFKDSENEFVMKVSRNSQGDTVVTKDTPIIIDIYSELPDSIDLVFAVSGKNIKSDINYSTIKINIKDSEKSGKDGEVNSIK